MLDEINFEELDLEPLKFMKFKEYLDFKLEGSKSLSFMDFQKHCGISKKQWELFKFNNKDFKKIEWTFQ